MENGECPRPARHKAENRPRLRPVFIKTPGFAGHFYTGKRFCVLPAARKYRVRDTSAPLRGVSPRWKGLPFPSNLVDELVQLLDVLGAGRGGVLRLLGVQADLRRGFLDRLHSARA